MSPSNSGADRALVASDQARAGLGPSGFDHGEKYRGWTLDYSPPPIPIRSFDWVGTGPNFDASYEGEEDDWVGNGQQVFARTRDALIVEIDDWFAENEPHLGGETHDH